MKQHAIIEKCKRLIVEHAKKGEKFTFKELSKEVGMSPFHLHRVFKARVGLTPRAYALEQRQSFTKH